MRLSIITINYNNREGLLKTIDSVISQTWRDFEWIVIDGGSTDGSKELIEQSHEHFTYWCSEPDHGIYNAINKGIAFAKGDYISCMNSGDTFYESETLEKVFSIVRSSDILYGNSMEIYNDHNIIRYYPSPSPLEFHNLFRWCFCHQAMFVKTSMLKEKGFDESFKIYADRMRWTQAAIEGKSFEYIDLVICRYDMCGISQTIDREIYYMELERVYNEAIPTPILLSVKKLIEYEDNTTIQRVRYLLMRGGLTMSFTKCVIRLLNSFVRSASAIKTYLSLK